MLTRLFTKLISDELTEFSYDAACAGLHYRVYNSAVGLNVMLAGYSHKLPVLLTAVLTRTLILTLTLTLTLTPTLTRTRRHAP